MKRIKNLILSSALTLSIVSYTIAGNVQRAGQAGASELMVNPWAAGSGWGGANIACIQGHEAIFTNIAGTVFINNTDLIFARSNWLSGSQIYINAFGLSQKMGKNAGVLSLSIMSMDFGKIMITTVNSPEGGLGDFHPQYTNIQLGYAKGFSNSIYGGMVFKIINEAISNLNGNGVALDAGIQYVTGKENNLKFGISLKNVGPPMRFKGDGLSFKGQIPNSSIEEKMTVEHRSGEFEMPALLKIGMSYDFLIYSKKDTLTAIKVVAHRITPAIGFTSNAFSKDNFHFGIEYAWNDLIMIRGGYRYQSKNGNIETFTDAFNGPTGGLSVKVPLNRENKTSFSIDYSYRSTFNFSGVHSIGAKLSL